jgi:hypothetical protein
LRQSVALLSRLAMQVSAESAPFASCL